MKRALIIFFLFLLTVNLFAQRSKKVRPDTSQNVIFIKRTIDIKDQLGYIFFKVLNRKIYESALFGKIPAYMNDSFRSLYSHDQLIMKGIRYDSVKMVNDTGTVLKDTSVLNPFNIEFGVKSYNISEKLIFSSKSNSFREEISAFGLNDLPVVYGAYTLDQPLFWVRYNDLKSLLSPEELKKFNDAIYCSDILSLARLVAEPVTLENSDIRIVNSDEVRCIAQLKTNMLAGEEFVVALNRAIDSLIKTNTLLPYRDDSFKMFYTTKEFYAMPYAFTNVKVPINDTSNALLDEEPAKGFKLSPIEKSHNFLVQLNLDENQVGFAVNGKIEGISLKTHLYMDDVDFGTTDICWIRLSELEKYIKEDTRKKLKELIFNTITTNLSKLPLPSR